MSELALKLIKEAKEQRLTRLDLGNCGLTELPDELFELTWLEELSLSTEWWEYDFEKKEFENFKSENEGEANYIKSFNPKLKLLRGIKKLIAAGEDEDENWELNDLSILKDLQNLQYINVASTQINTLIPLKNLKYLNYIDVSFTPLVSINAIIRLESLEFLNISFTLIKDINPINELENLQQYNLFAKTEMSFKFFQNLKYLILSFTEISDLSPIKHLKNIEFLDISSTEIIDLSSIKYLKNLEYLDASETQINSISSLQHLTKLRFLNVSSTQVDNFIFYPLKYLTDLHQLHIGGTNVKDLIFQNELQKLQKFSIYDTSIKDISPLMNLPNLLELSIARTQVIDITILEKLYNLQHIDISHTQVTDIFFLKDLINLKSLNVSLTEVSDLSPLKDLTQLQRLVGIETHVSDLSPLKALRQLQQLNFDSTHVHDLSPLKALTQLQQLNFNNTQVHDLSPLKALTQLQQLNVNYTQVSNLSPLKDLTQLQNLNVNNTQVRDLSPLKDLIKNGLYFNADNCPIDKGLKAAIKKGNEAVIKYFNKPQKRLFEARVLVLGEPRAGKTTLRHKLKSTNAALPKEKDSTKGIEIEIENYKCVLEKAGQKEKMLYYLWDFGGQDYYRLFHQLFVSEQSVYVIVTDTNKDTNEAEENLEFWLETIERLAKDKNGQYGPVILVQNAKSNREGKNYYDVKKRYPFWQQTEDFTINLGQIAENTDGYNPAELKRFKQFKAYLENSFHQLEHIGMTMPADWIKVRKAIAKQTKDNYISIEEFRKICVKCGVTELQEQDDLCGILHNLGFLLYYSETALKNMVILNKEWATDALYRVLDDALVRTNFGWFKKEDATTIWHDEKYKDRTNELLLLMQEYKIVYFNTAAQKYIVPTKLPESTEGLPEWNKNQNVRLHLQYDWLPRVVGTQLMVSLHEHLVSLDNGNDWIWRKGAVLNGKKLDLTDVEVLIEDNWKDKRLEITARGNHSEYLIREIIKEWRKVNTPFDGKVAVSKIILCACDKCQTASKPFEFEYEEVLDAQAAKDTLKCNKSRKEFSAAEILRGVFDETTILVDAFQNKGNKISEEILNYIKNGQLKEALDKLPDDNMTVSMKRQYKLLRSNQLLGTLSFDEFNRETNKITSLLLSYLSEDRFFHPRKGGFDIGHLRNSAESFDAIDRPDNKPSVVHNYYNSQVYHAKSMGKVEYNNSLGISKEEFETIKRQVEELSPEKQEDLKALVVTSETPTTEAEKKSMGKKIYNWFNKNGEDITKEVTAAAYFETLKLLFLS